MKKVRTLQRAGAEEVGLGAGNQKQKKTWVLPPFLINMPIWTAAWNGAERNTYTHASRLQHLSLAPLFNKAALNYLRRNSITFIKEKQSS